MRRTFFAVFFAILAAAIVLGIFAAHMRGVG